MPGSGKLRCTVEIELDRQVVFFEYLQTYPKTAVKALCLLEKTIERFACGVIGRQDKRGELISESSIGRAVKEEHLSFFFPSVFSFSDDGVSSVSYPPYPKA
jgi:hypothetical protein